MNSKKFKQRTTPLEIDFGEGDVLKLTYRPNAITTDEALADGRSPRENVMLAARLIAEWDLTEGEEDTPVPLTPEAVGEQPINLVGRIISAILEDMQVPQARSST